MARILIACEFSGIVRDAFIALGHDALSCDLEPTEIPGPHYQGDVRDILGNGWDLMIAHPPCTYLSRAGARWWAGNERQQADALELVRCLMAAPISRIAIENPPGKIGTAIRKADQTIQPWQFGHSTQKTTQLWLTNLPKLVPTNVVSAGEFVTYASGRRLPKEYANLGKKNRGQIRSRTFPGIASAMAAQWTFSLTA